MFQSRYSRISTGRNGNIYDTFVKDQQCGDGAEHKRFLKVQPPILIQALEMLETKRDKNLPKKHGNIPL